jgi:transcriptional regulator with XRE-family HTH domain
MIYKYGRTIPEFVKRFREDNNMTQEELAKRLKFHPQYVSNVERGVHRCPESFCYSLGKILSELQQFNHLVELVTEERSTIISEKAGKYAPRIKRRRP